jgi:hypothetical protein
MWKKIAIAGGVCAAIVGVGTTALATSGSSPVAGSPSSAKPGNQHLGKALRRALHAQWVTQDKNSKSFVTHDAIRGTVTAVSPTSITVRSLDSKSETFTVTSATKVRIRKDGTGAKGAISQVHAGDTAIVIGTGTSPLTARGILDGAK